MKGRTHFLIVGIDGALAVALGAFGAHGLQERLLAAGSLDTWQTAVQYQFVHVLALLGLLAVLPRATAERRIHAVAGCWLLGTVFFSGSLYWLALGGPKWLGPVTPLGGLLFIAGWLVVCSIRFKGETA